MKRAAILPIVALLVGIVASHFATAAYFKTQEVRPRQDKIDELYRENITLKGELERWQDRALRSGH